MKGKPVVPRERANQDVEEALDDYLGEGTEQAAWCFVDELEAAYRQISQHPAIGSPRYAHELNLPGLRTWPLTRYPYLIFYIERHGHIDVWCVLHAKKHIPDWMQDS